MPDITSHPVSGQNVSSDEFAENQRIQASLADRVYNPSNDALSNTAVGPFAISSAGLTLNLASGQAWIQGRDVGDLTDDTFPVSKPLTDNDTNHVFLGDDGNFTINTTGTGPASSIKLFEVVTSGGGVTGSTNFRDDTIWMNAPTRVRELDVDGDMNVEDVHQAGNQPYHEFTDLSVGGETFRIWNRNGKLQVTDASGATVHTDDLANITGGGGGGGGGSTNINDIFMMMGA